MLHRVKKTKFKHGSDANKMVMRKLLVNFFSHGKMKVTVKKAKAMKPEIERIVEKSKKENEANKIYVSSKLSNRTITNKLFTEIGPALKDKTGGYVRVKRFGQRGTDAAELALVEWAYPVIKPTPQILTPKKEEKKQ